jgi:hypothetical protein
MNLLKNKQPKKYADQPAHPHITREYENELKKEYGKMLVNMSKDFGKKLNEILK